MFIQECEELQKKYAAQQDEQFLEHTQQQHVLYQQEQQILHQQIQVRASGFRHLSRTGNDSLIVWPTIRSLNDFFICILYIKYNAAPLV